MLSQDIRKDFPILQSKMNGKPLVFLDSAASSQMPKNVINAFANYYHCRHANIHRGAYRLSYETTDLYEKTRERLAKFLGAPEPESCIFTRNATESLNIVARTWGEENIKEGDEILVSELEHHSNLLPWIQLAQRKKASLHHLPLSPDGFYDMEQFDKVCSKRTRLIALQHMSNVLGTIHDIKLLSQKAKELGAVFVIDGSQGVPHLKVNLAEIDCDFYAFSAHKMLGPTGLGVLYARKEILEKLDPFLGGGDMLLWATKDSFSPAPLPRRFEAGTPNIVAVIAFHIALDYIDQIGLDNIHKHEQDIVNYAYEKIQKLKGIKIYGPALGNPKRGGILSFNIEGVHSHDLATILDEDGVAIRAGHHCCEPWMQKEKLVSTARISFYIYNTLEDVDRCYDSLKKVISIFN